MLHKLKKWLNKIKYDYYLTTNQLIVICLYFLVFCILLIFFLKYIYIHYLPPIDFRSFWENIKMIFNCIGCTMFWACILSWFCWECYKQFPKETRGTQVFAFFFVGSFFIWAYCWGSG